MATLNRIAVVGGGLTGLRAAEELRRHGFSGEVVLIGKETEHPYDRPPLSKRVLQEGGAEPPYLRAPADYARLDVDLRLGTEAVALHADERSLKLADGQEVPYDAVVLATGAVPRRIPGLDGPGFQTVRTHADAVRLREEMRRHGRVVVVGAGFIGCEVAASARGMGVETTVIEALPAPLTRVLGGEVAAEVARLHTRAGVDLRCGATVASARRDGDRLRLALSTGEEIDAEVVVVGIGVVPETGWLESSGIELGDGVRCDEYGRTSLPGVWAAGDAAAWWQPHTRRHRRFEHWTSAADQAIAVARNILAANGELRGVDDVPYFWSDQYDVKIQSLGTPSAEDEVVLLRVGPQERLLAVYGREGGTTAVVGFGAAPHVMRLRALVARSAPVQEVVEAARR